MTAVEELVDALTEAGLTFGRPAANEVRVKGASGREYWVKVMRFSFMVAPDAGASFSYQRLTVAEVLDMVRA